MAVVNNVPAPLVCVMIARSDGTVLHLGGTARRLIVRPPKASDDTIQNQTIFGRPLVPDMYTDVELRLDPLKGKDFSESDRDMVAMAMAVLQGDREAALQLADRVLDAYHKER